MYAQTDNPARAPSTSAARPTRAALRARPRAQRILIRSWEYIEPVRGTFLAIRLHGVLCLIVLGALLMAAGYTWGLTLIPAAVAMAAVSVWVFRTAAKGWTAEATALAA